jgi:hypothetical protein
MLREAEGVLEYLREIYGGRREANLGQWCSPLGEKKKRMRLVESAARLNFSELDPSFWVMATR